MKVEIARKIVEAVEDSGSGNEVELRENYSGRGMFGKQTAGVVGSLSDIIGAIAAVAFEMGNHGDDEVEFLREMRRLRTDNMGHNIIVY